MSKIKKFPGLKIRKITGGKDPVKLVEDFILRHGFDPDECLKDQTGEISRWMLNLGDGEDLEILVESLKKPAETTIYMGINIATVPVRGAHDMLAAALEIADGLVGIKVSLVGHFLVLSANMGLAGCDAEDLDYNFKLITAQQTWFKDALAEELNWEELPED